MILKVRLFDKLTSNRALIILHHITSQSASTSLCPYHLTSYHQPISIHITVSFSVLISIHQITSQSASTSMCPYHHTSNHQPISIHINVSLSPYISNHQPISIHINVSLSPYIKSPANQHPHQCVLITIHQSTSQSAFTSLCPLVSLSPYIKSPANQHPHQCVL